MSKEKKNRTPKYKEDDGRTVANMNVEGFRWYRSEKARAAEDEMRRLSLTKKERRAIRRAGLLSAVPFILLVLAVFGLMFLVGYLWLN